MSPCNWPVSYAACSSCTPLDDMTTEERTLFEEMAVDFLWNWTLKQFGVCRVTLRPCRAEDYLTNSYSTFTGSGPLTQLTGWVGTGLVDGEWTSLNCGQCRTPSCGCGPELGFILPGPVVSVSEIVMDGTALTTTDYVVDYKTGRITRTDGESWPRCQDLTAAPTEYGTWQVTYDKGVEVPVGGQLAAGVLACELAKAACNDGSCQLPQRVQTVTRQGVTMALLDTFEDVTQGRTGIWLIDSWVASETAPRRVSTIHSVDIPIPGKGVMARG